MIGIKDLDKQVLLKTSSHTEFLTCSTLNKYLFSLYDENLYRKRMELYFPAVKNKDNLTYKKLYLYNLSIVETLKEIYKFDFKSGDPKKYIKILSQPMAFQAQANYIAKYGYEDLLHIIFPQEYDVALSGAASSGNMKLVCHFMDLGANDYDFALFCAIKHNHRSVINLFLSLGASDWQEFLPEAERYNHVDLIKLFKSKM